jgi:hypothetical protein
VATQLMNTPVTAFCYETLDVFVHERKAGLYGPGLLLLHVVSHMTLVVLLLLHRACVRA